MVVAQVAAAQNQHLIKTVAGAVVVKSFRQPCILPPELMPLTSEQVAQRAREAHKVAPVSQQ